MGFDGHDSVVNARKGVLRSGLEFLVPVRKGSYVLVLGEVRLIFFWGGMFKLKKCSARECTLKGMAQVILIGSKF